MKSIGFKKTILISIVILVSLCLLTTNWIAYSKLKNSTIDNINTHSQTIIKYETSNIESWFSTKALLIDSLATRYENSKQDNDYVSIARLAKKIGELSTVYLGFDDGSAYATEQGENWVDGVAIKSQYDPRIRPWYQLAKATNGLALTDVYLDAVTGQPVVSLVKNFGTGVVLGDIALSVLNSTVKQIDFPGAVTAITDQSGKALASNSSILKVGTKLTDIGMGNVQKSMLLENESTLDYTLDGVNKLAFTKAIKLINGEKWYLFIGVDKSVAYAQVTQALHDAIISSLIMLAIALLLVVVVLNSLYKPILTLKEMIIDLSTGNGDLTHRLLVTSNDDLGEIAQGINKFIENLQSLMREVSQTSGQISNSVTNLTNQTDANNQVLNAHAMETDQIVAAIEEMSATANDVAGNAAEASRFTHDTNIQVSNSHDVVINATNIVLKLVEDVENTATSIHEIAKYSDEINSVLNIIGSIAAQTNLLALNAAIEAARAGEQGRGFAVVADEVRALAGRTQSSTAEIEETLNKLMNGSKTAISAMDATKSTCEKTTENTTLVANDLGNIAQSVTNIDDLNTLIATAAEQQSSVAEDITRNMTAIREIVSELSVNGESTSSEALNLAAANSQLKSVVGKFKLQ